MNKKEREKFLNDRLQKSITVCLVDGIELKGKLIAYDDTCVIIEVAKNPAHYTSYSGKTVMIEKGSFSMIF